MSRAGFSIIELLISVVLLSVFFLVAVPLGHRLASQQAEAGRLAEDLEQGIVLADRLGRELRAARGVVARTPDRRVSSGPSGLVLITQGGGLRAFHVESGDVAGGWLIQSDYRPGRAPRHQRLGFVGRVDFRFDARLPSAVRAVSYDLILPARTPGAQERALSSRALLGPAEAP